jgi:DNA-binding transcriptional LysR family regulator
LLPADSALKRRILATEAELCVAIFERLPHGVRLSTTCELLVHRMRNQLSGIERMKAQIVDLAGAPRGHVPIACS